MSEHAPAPPKAEVFDPKHAGNLPLAFLAAGVLGLLVSLIGAFVWHEQFAYSWLFAFFYFFSLAIGALFWVLVHHATDAEWSVVVRRLLENFSVLIPVMFVFFIPLLFCADTLWKWWDVPHGVDSILDEKRGYLNHPFFFLRIAFYFIGLSAVALLLRRHSTAQDATGSPRNTIVMRKLAVAGIPLLAISLTFSGYDWLLGLDYKWFSTMWGVYLFAGAAGSGMSLLVLTVTILRHRGYLQFVTLEHYHIMGKLMLAFCVFWAYIGFSQYMLIWYANIPEETSYFIRRNIESWNYLSTFLVVGRFFLPFALLLTQWVKKRPRWLAGVAAWILFMQLLDIYIIVMPMFDATGFRPSFLDLFALVGMGGVLGFVFLRQLAQSNIFPLRDPRLPESLRLTN
jgi:hypothetical protein